MKKSAFTLIELLVVIVIIGVLATISVAQFNSYQDRARQAKIDSEFWQSHRHFLANCAILALDDCRSETVPISGEIITGSNSNIGRQVVGTQMLKDNGTEKWCYDNDSSNCDTLGGLYTWQAARNACPTGWHLPTIPEMTSILSYFQYTTYERGFGMLRSDQTNSRGNEEGFSVLMGGQRTIHGIFDNGAFYAGNQRTYYWVDGVYGSLGATLYVTNYNPNASIGGMNKSIGASVRCVKD